jgi:hypothetical protein
MKFRLAALVIFLCLFLGACSLAEDITPPPGYSHPPSAPTLAPITPTLAAISTVPPATATSEITPATTQSTTPVANLTTTPAASLGTFTGMLSNGSGGAIPAGQSVTLVGLDQDQTGSYQKVSELQSPVNGDGSYRFTGVAVALNRAFLIVSSYAGIEYQSDPVIVKDATTSYSIPITIYDKTNDFNGLTLDQVHLKFDLSSQNIISVTELFIVTNPGKQVVFVNSDGTAIPFLPVPTGASGVQFQLAQGSAQLLNATGGFALLPGSDKQYGFLASFSMPYTKSLKYNQLFTLPVSSLTVFVPQGVRLSGDQLTSAGPQTIQSQTYQMYQSNKMAAGSSLSMALSGKPGTSTGLTFDRQTLILIGIGIVGILLIGMGIYLYLRDRARLLKEEREEQQALQMQAGLIEEDALGVDSDDIMDAMIALDDQYKAGEIPREAYEKRRNELKERLKGSLAPQS